MAESPLKRAAGSELPGRKVAAEHERQRSSRSPSHNRTPGSSDRNAYGKTEIAYGFNEHASFHS